MTYKLMIIWNSLSDAHECTGMHRIPTEQFVLVGGLFTRLIMGIYNCKTINILLHNLHYVFNVKIKLKEMHKE